MSGDYSSFVARGAVQLSRLAQSSYCEKSWSGTAVVAGAEAPVRDADFAHGSHVWAWRLRLADPSLAQGADQASQAAVGGDPTAEEAGASEEKENLPGSVHLKLFGWLASSFPSLRPGDLLRLFQVDWSERRSGRGQLYGRAETLSLQLWRRGPKGLALVEERNRLGLDLTLRPDESRQLHHLDHWWRGAREREARKLWLETDWRKVWGTEKGPSDLRSMRLGSEETVFVELVRVLAEGDQLEVWEWVERGRLEGRWSAVRLWDGTRPRTRALRLGPLDGREEALAEYLVDALVPCPTETSPPARRDGPHPPAVPTVTLTPCPPETPPHLPSPSETSLSPGAQALSESLGVLPKTVLLPKLRLRWLRDARRRLVPAFVSLTPLQMDPSLGASSQLKAFETKLKSQKDLLLR